MAITKIQLRRDVAANWTLINPILAQGEVGLELDTYKFKWGDGATAWNDLDYYADGVLKWGNITGTLSDQTDLQNELDLKFNSADFSSTFDSNLAGKTTDDITQGATNLYDQLVVLNSGTGINVTGTYPNFTINNTEIATNEVISVADINSTTTLDVNTELNLITASSNITLTLPPATGNDKKVINLKRIDSNNTNIVTVNPDGVETIDGELTFDIRVKENFKLVAENNGWNIL